MASSSSTSIEGLMELKFRNNNLKGFQLICMGIQILGERDFFILSIGSLSNPLKYFNWCLPNLHKIHVEILPNVYQNFFSLIELRLIACQIKLYLIQVLKFGSYIVDELRQCTQPVLIYIPPYAELRGGAWVVIDPFINYQVMEMYADTNSRGGVLEPEGMLLMQCID